MSSDILTIDLAYKALKEGLVVVDFNFNRFKLNSDKVIVKNNNARYILKVEEFLNLYKEKKFTILEDSESIIDSKKDEEYYSFKHK